MFEESKTVAAIFVDPLAAVNEVWLVFSNANEMDTTGQVINCTGGLVAPAMVVKIVVIPGATAFTCAWPGSSPVAEVLTVATVALKVFQLNGPTVEVISTP